MDSSQSHNLFRNEWNESLDIICRYMNQSFNHLMIMNDDEKTAALQNVDQ